MKFTPTLFLNALSEEKQQKQITFSYAIQKEENTYTNLIPFAHCRDFLSDVKIAELLEKSIIVYGLNYNPKNTPSGQTDTLRLILRFDNNYPEELINFNKNLHYINVLESFYKIKETTFLELTKEVNDFYTYLLIETDIFWYSHPITISFYSFFLRCLTYNIDPNIHFWVQITQATFSEPDWQEKKIEIPTYDAKLLNKINYNKTLINLIYNFPRFIKNHDFISEKETLLQKIKDKSIHDYDLHNQVGFISLIEKMTLFNLTITQKQILKEKNNYICPADVTRVIPFLQN